MFPVAVLQIREERRRERERERRLEAKDAHGGKKSKLTRDRDRDISEKVRRGGGEWGELAMGGSSQGDSWLLGNPGKNSKLTRDRDISEKVRLCAGCCGGEKGIWWGAAQRQRMRMWARRA